MPQTLLHILFSAAAAGSLHQALAATSRTDEVICLHDNLSIGPIDSLDPHARLRWLASACRLGIDEWNWFPDEVRRFWSRALSGNQWRIIWFTRNSAKEFAGLLACLERFGDAPLSVIDGTELRVTVRQKGGAVDAPILSLGELAPDQINKVLDTDRPLPAQRLAAFHDRWAALRTEGALLRVVAGDGELTSVPIGFFDEALLSACSFDWQRASRVIATAMFSTIAARLHAVDDLFLCSRVLALLGDGRLEARESVADWSGERVMREAHLRLRAQHHVALS